MQTFKIWWVGAEIYSSFGQDKPLTSVLLLIKPAAPRPGVSASVCLLSLPSVNRCQFVNQQSYTWSLCHSATETKQREVQVLLNQEGPVIGAFGDLHRS